MSLLAEENRLRVQPTASRRKRDYYYVQVSPDTARRLRLGRWAVAAFQHPALQFDKRLAANFTRILTIHCKVEVVQQLPNDLGLFDQTLRNALGAPAILFPRLTSLHFHLFPARRSWFGAAKLAFASLFGIRYLAFRAKISDVLDMEKGYVRVPTAPLMTLGVAEGDDLILERPLASFSPDGRISHFKIAEFRSSAFSATDRMVDYRTRMEEAFPDRYGCGTAALYSRSYFAKAGLLPGRSRTKQAATDPHEPDLPPVFMDYDARQAGISADSRNPPVEPVTPIMARRSIRSGIAREALQTGITFGIALTNLMLAAGVLREGGLMLRHIVGAVAIASLTTAVLLIARLRQQV